MQTVKMDLDVIEYENRRNDTPQPGVNPILVSVAAGIAAGFGLGISIGWIALGVVVGLPIGALWGWYRCRYSSR